MSPKERRDHAKLLRQLMYSAPHESPPLAESLRKKLAGMGAITIVHDAGSPRAKLTGLGTAVALQSVAAMFQRNGLLDLALAVNAEIMVQQRKHLDENSEKGTANEQA